MRLTRIVFSIVALLATASVSQASFETFRYEGSRDDIRAYCEGEGRTLVEEIGYTLCQDEMTGANHLCYAAGGCVSAGSRPILVVETDPIVTGGTAFGMLPMEVVPFAAVLAGIAVQ